MWKGLVLALLSLATLSSEALATDRHVRPNGGNDVNDGLTYATAVRTITKVNGQVQPGDRVYLWPGTHAGIIDPTAAATGGNRFTFIGAALNGKDPIADGVRLPDTLQRATILVPGGNLSKPYVTIKGVYFTGELSVRETADRDSILYTTHTYGLDSEGADYTCYANNVYLGAGWDLNKNVLGHSDGISIYNCDFRHIGFNLTGIQGHLKQIWSADSTTEMFNRFLITAEPTLDQSVGCEWHFDDQNRVSRGNYTFINIKRRVYEVWRYRSDKLLDVGCFNNTMDCDTIICIGSPPAGAGPNDFSASSSANCGFTDCVNGCVYSAQCIGAWNSSMDSCLIDASGIGGDGSNFNFQGGMWNYDISYTTIAMNGYALDAFDVKSGCVLDHNTFAGQSPGGVIRFSDSNGRPGFNVNALTFTNNILYSFTPALANDPSTTTNGRYGIWWATSKLDSAGKGHGQDKATVNNNLYSYYGSTGTCSGGAGTACGDRSGALRLFSSAVTSSPGDSSSTTNPRGRLDNRYRLDSLSVYGSPEFDRGGPDSVAGRFDAHIGWYSAARGTGSGGTDIGAVAWNAVDSDPALDVSPRTVSLMWTGGVPDTEVVVVTNLSTANCALYFMPTPTTLTHVGIDPLYANGQTQQLGSGAQVKIYLVYPSSGNGPGPGTQIGDIVLHTDDPRQPLIGVHITAQGP